MSAAANADPSLVAQHLAPGPRNAFQRFFTPMTQEQLDKAKEIAQTGQYQQLMGGLEKQKVGLQQQGVDIDRGRAATEAANVGSETEARKAAADIEQKKVAEGAREFGLTLPSDVAYKQGQTTLAGAQTGAAQADTHRAQIINRQMDAQQDQQQLVQLEKSHPEIDNTAASAVLQKLGPPSQYFVKNPDKNAFDYENEFTTQARAFNQARQGTPSSAPVPQGLGALFSHLFQGGQGGPTIGPPGDIQVNGPTIGNPTPASVGVSGPTSAPIPGNGQMIPPAMLAMLQKFQQQGPANFSPPMGQGGPR